jgi:hypothetical protein
MSYSHWVGCQRLPPIPLCLVSFLDVSSLEMNAKFSLICLQCHAVCVCVCVRVCECVWWGDCRKRDSYGEFLRNGQSNHQLRGQPEIRVWMSGLDQECEGQRGKQSQLTSAQALWEEKQEPLGRAQRPSPTQRRLLVLQILGWASALPSTPLSSQSLGWPLLEKNLNKQWGFVS